MFDQNDYAISPKRKDLYAHAMFLMGMAIVNS